MKKYYSTFITIVALLLLVICYLEFKRFNSQRVLIVVNGQPIHMKDLNDRVDYLYSKQLLSKMIWTMLVQEEATQKNCMPTDADITKAIADMDRSTPSVTYSARKSDPSLVLFKDVVRTNLALRNLQVYGVKVTPDQVQEFYDTHKAMFALPSQSQTRAVIAKDDVARDAAKSMLEDDISPDVIAQTPGMRVVGINLGFTGPLPASISNQLLKLKTGDIGVYPLEGQYLVVKVLSVAQEGTPPLDQIRPQVEMAARLAIAPSETAVLTDLRRRATITPGDTDKYADAIPSVSDVDSPTDANGQ